MIESGSVDDSVSAMGSVNVSTNGSVNVSANGSVGDVADASSTVSGSGSRSARKGVCAFDDRDGHGVSAHAYA